MPQAQGPGSSAMGSGVRAPHAPPPPPAPRSPPRAHPLALVWVLVRVVLERQLSVGLLDLLGRRAGLHPQDVVVLRLFHHRVPRPRRATPLRRPLRAPPPAARPTGSPRAPSPFPVPGGGASRPRHGAGASRWRHVTIASWPQPVSRGTPSRGPSGTVSPGAVPSAAVPPGAVPSGPHSGTGASAAAFLRCGRPLPRGR